MAADSEGGGNSEKRERERERGRSGHRSGSRARSQPPPPPTHTHPSLYTSKPLLTYILMFPSQWHKWTLLRETHIQEHFSHTHGLYVSWQRDMNALTFPGVNLTGTCGMISSAQSQKSTSKCLNKLQINDNHKLVLLNILYCVNNFIVRENLFINLKKLKHFKINQAVSIQILFFFLVNIIKNIIHVMFF